MRFSQVRGLPVVDVATGTRAGSISDGEVDTDSQEVVALTVNLPGIFSGHRVLTWSDIKSVGQDAVTIASEDVLRDRKDAQLGTTSDASALIGRRIMTESGSDVGTVSDFDIDATSGAVTEYILSEGVMDRLQHREHLVPAAWVQSIGSNVIVVRRDAGSPASQPS